MGYEAHGLPLNLHRTVRLRVCALSVVRLCQSCAELCGRLLVVSCGAGCDRQRAETSDHHLDMGAGTNGRAPHTAHCCARQYARIAAQPLLSLTCLLVHACARERFICVPVRAHACFLRTCKRISRIAIRPAGASLHNLQGSVDGALRDIAKFLQSWSLYDSLRPVRAARGWHYASISSAAAVRL